MHKRERNFPLSSTFETIVSKDNVQVCRYPELDVCYNALSKYFSLSHKSLLLTSGCDVAIRTVYESIEQTSLFLLPFSCYAMNHIYISVYHPQANIETYSLSSNGNLNIPRLLTKIPLLPANSVILLESPSGQTGRVIDHSLFPALLSAAQACGITIIVDETYLETRSGNTSTLSYLSSPNLVVVTSFSKAFGLAGLRAGAIFSHPDNINIFKVLKPMHEITSATASVLCYALNDIKSLTAYRNQILLDEQKWVAWALRTKRFTLQTTDCNFIRFRPLIATSTSVHSFLRSRNIMVKLHAPIESDRPWLSASLGNDDDTEVLLHELSNFEYSGPYIAS